MLEPHYLYWQQNHAPIRAFNIYHEVVNILFDKADRKTFQRIRLLNMAEQTKWWQIKKRNYLLRRDDILALEVQDIVNNCRRILNIMHELSTQLTLSVVSLSNGT
jgi:hypothetical protein